MTTAQLPVVHTLSGLAYRPEQDSGDAIVCRRCRDPLPDPDIAPVEHDCDGFAWHDTCWVEAGMHELADEEGTHEFRRSASAAWKCECGVSRQSKVHGWKRGPKTDTNVALPDMPAPPRHDGDRVETVDLQPGDRVITTIGVGFDFGIPIVRPHYGKRADGEAVIRTVRSSLRETGGHVVRFEENRAKSEVIRGTTRWIREGDAG